MWFIIIINMENYIYQDEGKHIEELQKFATKYGG